MIYSVFLFSQSPAIQWSKKFGGGMDDNCFDILKTSENNFIVIGSTRSASGDVIGFRGAQDVWMIKIDNLGNLIWSRCLGGIASEYGASIQQTSDGGFIFIGSTSSNTIDVSGLHVFGGAPFGYDDIWAVKTDSTGQIEWQKCIGSDDDDLGFQIIPTSDSSYFILGQPHYFGGDITTFYGLTDVWVAKINSVGIVQWDRSFGGYWNETPNGMTILSDHSILIAAGVTSNDGNVTCSNPNNGVWIIKLDSTGNEIWQKCYGGSSYDEGFDIVESNNGGFYIAASTGSSDGDVTGLIGLRNYWILKCDSSGTILWQKCFGGTSIDQIRSMTKCFDGGIIACGSTESLIAGNHGMKDAYIIKIDSLGNLEWEKCFGGSGDDEANSVIQLQDSSYVVAGSSNSTDGDIINYRGAQDFWVFKLSAASTAINEIKSTYSSLKGFVSEQKLTINFNSTTNELLLISVFDILGKKLFSEKINAHIGLNEFSFNVNFSKQIGVIQIQGRSSILSSKIF